MRKRNVLNTLCASCFLGAGLTALALPIFLAAPTADAGAGLPREVEELFFKGLEALNFEQWEKAEKLIRDAQERWPQCGSNVRQEGMFNVPYLPTFLPRPGTVQTGKVRRGVTGIGKV